MTTERVRLLSDADIYDIYGCQALLVKDLSTFHKSKVVARIQDIQAMYVSSAKARIRSEARFCGVDIDDDSLSRMLEKVKEFVSQDLQTQMMGGGRVNLMQSILKGHKMAGSDLSGINLAKFGVDEKPIEKPPDPSVDPKWFMKGDKNSKMWDNPKWAEIAKTFVDIEMEKDPMQVCVKIDMLNACQHNSFHVLIDLQTGRMLEGKSTGDKYGKDREARQTLQDILELIKGAREPMEFTHKMSAEVKELMNKYKDYPEKQLCCFEQT